MEDEHSLAGGPHVLEPTQDEINALLIRAIQGGVTAASPGPVPPGVHVVIAAGVAGRYASVIVMRRDPEEMALLDDTYFLTQDETGQWIPPSASSGGANHEWVLHRPERGADYRDWQASELVPLGGQWGFVQGNWLTDLTVMASRVVVEVGVSYAGQESRHKVPPNGVLTVPAILGGVDDVAHFCACDHAGAMIAQAEYRPIQDGDDDPRLTWPNQG